RQSMMPFIVLTFILWLVCYTIQPFDKIRFLIYFFIGAYFWINRDKFTYKWYAVAGLWAIAFLFFNTQFFFAVAFIAIPYTIIWFANLPLKHLSRFGKYGDFSYGMYIYAYPIQQTIIHFLPSVEVWQLIILSFAITMPVAAASWYLIEQHALLKKNRKEPTEQTEAKST
ncbi:MAG: acyltransferase, partial [Methanomicrobium sp.]|nr:acyltransferase [Methanomicrobium sp.]